MSGVDFVLLVTNVAVFVSSICSSSLPLPPLRWGMGIARRADRPIFQMYVAAPLKGCSLVLYTMWFSQALQDSRGGGGGGGGVCAQSKSSLALPLFVSSDQ